MKRQYLAPKLTELGDIKEITQQGSWERSAGSGGYGFRGNGLRGISFGGFTQRRWNCIVGGSG